MEEDHRYNDLGMKKKCDLDRPETESKRYRYGMMGTRLNFDLEKFPC
jgi:hypothetical protein